MTREEAILWLTNEKWKNANNKYKKEWNEAFDMAIDALQAVPNCQKCAIKELWKETEKEDVVEVVRCKDCDNFDYAFNYCNFLDAGVEGEDFFCAYGERREE